MHSMMLRKCEHRIKLSAKDMEDNGWPFKSHVFHRVQDALNFGAKGLKKWLLV